MKMKISFEKSAGVALLTGSLLLVATMVLHPAGGNLEHLIKAVRVIFISHSIALIAIPFLAVGFWGLTKKLGADNFFSITAFSMVLFALIGGMIAGAINGLALPIFIQNYKGVSTELAASIKPILRNNISLNQAFDYVLLSGICMAILFWSIAILLTKKITCWIGYFGILLFTLVVALLVTGFEFVNLHGFRIFLLAIVLWVGLIAIVLMRSQEDKCDQ